MQSSPSITIGFTVRERYSPAPGALRALFENTKEFDYRLIIVDSLTPPRYLKQIEETVAGRENVEFLRVDRYLMPNEARNLVASMCDTDYLVFLENDCYVSPGWLTLLLAAIKRHNAGVAVPLLLEHAKYHGDDLLGDFNDHEIDGETRLEVYPLGGKHEEQTSMIVESIESHLLLFDADVLRRLDLFDEALTTHDCIDISLTLRQAGVPIVFEPRAHADLVYPPPVEPEERAFFRERWSLEADRRSADRVRQKWQLKEIVSAKAFAKERLHRETHLQLGLYTARVRVWRRLRRLFKQYVLRQSLVVRLEYEQRPILEAAATSAAREGVSSGSKS
jgi:hypothetical protein